MSESHLPDDLAQWPDDPYLLLGVDHAVDRRRLRQAYARLIRIYRPEHCPDQFRRVREAYEYLDRYLRYRQECGDDEAENAATPLPHAAPPSRHDTTSASSSAAPVESPIDIAWRLACDGQPAEAYRQLRELERQQPSTDEVCLRLYWLLALHPDLAPGRDRRSWLVAGLAAASHSDPLLELYDRELAGDPSEARHPRCRNLLEQPASFSQRAAFAMRCWPHLGLIGSWDLIAQDLENFREPLATSNTNIWVRMLLASEEQFRWQIDRTACGPLADACHREVETYSEEHHELAWELDRSDYVEVLTNELRHLPPSEHLPLDTIRQLIELLRRGWSQPFGMIREDLLAFLRPMVEAPIRAMASLDHLYQTTPVVLHQLNLQVQALYLQRHDFQTLTAPTDEHPKAIASFLDKHEFDGYGEWRQEALLFCLRHGMTFSQFQQAASGLSLSSNLTEHWKSDLPLHCITTACEAFWAAG